MSDPEIRARLKRARFNDLVGAAFGVIVMTPIAGSIMIGFVSLLFDALDWLQKAVWPVHTLESVLKHFEIYIPQTRFLGLNVMISKMLGASVEIWLILFGPVVWLGLGIALFSAIAALATAPRS